VANASFTVARSPNAHWNSQMAFLRRIIAGAITNVAKPDAILGDFNHDRCVLYIAVPTMGAHVWRVQHLHFF